LKSIEGGVRAKDKEKGHVLVDPSLIYLPGTKFSSPHPPLQLQPLPSGRHQEKGGDNRDACAGEA